MEDGRPALDASLRRRRRLAADLAGRRRLAGPRRRRPAAWLARRRRALVASAHVKDIAPAGQKTRPGRLDRCRRRHAGLAAAVARMPRGGRRVDGGRARQPQGPRRLRQGQLRLPQQACRPERPPRRLHHDPVTLGIIGCGNISDAYLRGAAGSSLVRGQGLRRPAGREAADGQGRSNTASPPLRSTSCWPTRRSRSSST